MSIASTVGPLGSEPGRRHEEDFLPAADFSEFSYGYAVVRQAEDLLATIGAGLVGAPTLPSLLKENTVGYDAELVAVDFALFLQFKRSFFVSRQHTQGPCGYVGGEPHCTWAYWTGELAKYLDQLARKGIDAERVLDLAATRKPLPVDHPTAALGYRVKGLVTPRRQRRAVPSIDPFPRPNPQQSGPSLGL